MARGRSKNVRGNSSHCEVCLDGVRGDLRLPTMAQIRYFVHVAGSQSFAATARDLDVTPTAVRLAIGELEELIGCKLVERSPTAITLNKAGLLVLPLAQRMLYLATVLAQAGERPA